MPASVRSPAIEKPPIENPLSEEELEAVKAIARETFIDADIELSVEEDPEIPNCRYVVFDVQVRDRSSDLWALHMEWARRILDLLDLESTKVRLSLTTK